MPFPSWGDNGAASLFLLGITHRIDFNYPDRVFIHAKMRLNPSVVKYLSQDLLQFTA